MQNTLRSVLLLSALAFVGCKVRPVDPEGTFAPVGTLQGAVVDQYDQLPIEGAKITINFDGFTATVTTDKSGSYAFIDIPASSNSTTAGGATGTYTVSLDLSQVKGDRKYKAYRTSNVAVQFTELRRAATTTTSAQGVQDSVPVSYLVSNMLFSVRQTRAKITGVVLDELLKPRNAQRLTLVYGPLNVNGAGGVAPNAVYAETTTDAMGQYTFTEVEEGASYTITVPDFSQFIQNAPNNYSGGSFTALELGVETKLAPMIVVTRPTSDNIVPYVLQTDPPEGAIRPTADLSKDITIKFSEPMNQPRGLKMVTNFRRMGPINRPDDSNVLVVLYQPKWDTTGQVLTITPTTPLEAGYRYSIDFNNANIVDLAGNARNNNIPFTNPAMPDALAIDSTVGNDLLFSVGTDAMELTVTGVTQEPDTADNMSPAAATRASQLENDPSATENSFLTAQNAGFFSANSTNHAYITWAAPSQPVRRFRIWTRVGNNVPVLISRSNNVWSGVSQTRLEPLPPTQLGFNMPLSDLSAIFNAEPGALQGIGLPNNFWNNGLSVQLGVSAVNSDGQEGDITWATLKDNTGPAFLKGNGLALDTSYLNSNDSATLSYTPNCSTSISNRVLCPKAANPVTGFPAATAYGQRFVLFDLSEPVDAASVTKDNVELVDGTLPNASGLDPNSSGGNTEGEASIANAVPVNVQNGRTTRIGVLFNDFFNIDTGDKLVLKKGTGAVKDVVGNAAKDTPFITASMVDNYPVLIKSVQVDAANDTVTLTLTKWARARNTPGPGTSFALSDFSFSNASVDSTPDITSGDNSSHFTKTTTNIVNGEMQVVMQMTDVGFLRGYNTTDTACSNGSRVGMVLYPTDYAAFSSRSQALINFSAGTNDTGTIAYENMLTDPAEPNFSPGAYMPVNGIGTRSAWRDTIPPRMSNNYTNRTASPGNYDVGANTTMPGTVEVSLTEYSANENRSNATDSALNPANWNLKMVALNAGQVGASAWTGKSGNDAAAGGISVTVNSVTEVPPAPSGCSRAPRYRINYTISNSNGSNTNVGLGRVALGATVADMAGNVVGTSASKAAWVYSPTRTNPQSGTVDPGWVVQ